MTLLIFLVVLSVLVLIHEAGHYFAARLFGVKADEFGYGFPPRLIGFVKDGGKWKRVKRTDNGSYKNTIWSLNWLPLGGFVRIKGESEEGINDKDSLHSKPIWQRIIIIAAGVVMNWILAAVLFFIIFLSGAVTVLDGLPENARVEDRHVSIVEVLKDSPAAKAGLVPGDRVIEMDGSAVTGADTVRAGIQAHGTSEISLLVRRGTEEIALKATPEMIAELNRPGLGIALSDMGSVSFGVLDAAWNAIWMTGALTKAITFAFFDLFRDLIVTRQVAQDVSGPVGIAVMTGEVAEQGLIPLMQFAAMLSVNLAVINFLPIPALDGGRVVFLFLEKIRRRPVSRKLEIAIHNIAFLLLITLILLVTLRDIGRYGGTIVGGLKGIVGM
jgi:regulator of sigma E protease